MNMTGLPIRIQDPTEGHTPKIGSKTVSVAGTAEKIVAAVTPCNQVIIQGIRTNTGYVFIGPVGVPNTHLGGVCLGARDAITLECNDLSGLYVNSTVNGEGVSFLYW